MVPADSDRVARAPPYSGYFALIKNYAYGPFTLSGLIFQLIPLLFNKFFKVLQPRSRLNDTGLGFSRFARRY